LAVTLSLPLASKLVTAGRQLLLSPLQAYQVGRRLAASKAQMRWLPQRTETRGQLGYLIDFPAGGEPQARTVNFLDR
jgi:hypothetical protein